MTQTLTTEQYTEGLCGDGAAILRDGVPMSVSEILAALNAADNREAQPVAYTEQCEISNMQDTGLYLRGFPDNTQGRNIGLFTAPPAPAVPPEIPLTSPVAAEYVAGWNACRAAMLAAAPEGSN
jgi:hypothetical protein